MAIQVSNYRKPQKVEEDSGIGKSLGTLGTIAGGIAGAFAGNPIAGASVGGQVGSTVGGLATKAPEIKGGGTPGSLPTGESAVTRRLGKLDEDKKYSGY
jgi:hypothetical protein